MKITKPSIKKFSLIAFIYSALLAVLFIVLFAITFTFPDYVANQTAFVAIGSILLFLLCAIVIWYYCVVTVYEIEKNDDGIIFKSLLKKHTVTADTDFKILATATRYIVKVPAKNDSFGKTLYLLKSIGLKSDIFTQEDIENIKNNNE